MITKEDINWIKENKGDDVGFIFYSGDVLQDTAMLNTKTKGVYMSIMCLHMKNICFSKQQICSFCEVLNEHESESLFSVLKEIEGCFFIEWVLDSIKKRREYSISRSKNRTKSNENETKDIKNISKTYVKHMVNENEIVIEDKKEKVIKSELEKVFDEFLEMRKKIKKPATLKAIELLKNKIRKLSNGSEQLAIQIIEQSIVNSWQDVFELRQDFKSSIKSSQKEQMQDAFKSAMQKMQQKTAEKYGINQ
jgi:hypothetical protein